MVIPAAFPASAVTVNSYKDVSSKEGVDAIKSFVFAALGTIENKRQRSSLSLLSGGQYPLFVSNSGNAGSAAAHISTAPGSNAMLSDVIT